MFDILIIDDDDLNRDIFYRMTAKLGYTVLCVSSAEDAYTILKSERFELVLLDLLMPGTSGRQAVKVIQGISKAPVIALSGHIDDSDIHELDSLGFSDYLCKPVFQEQLQALYKKWIKTA